MKYFLNTFLVFIFVISLICCASDTGLPKASEDQQDQMIEISEELLGVQSGILYEYGYNQYFVRALTDNEHLLTRATVEQTITSPAGGTVQVSIDDTINDEEYTGAITILMIFNDWDTSDDLVISGNYKMKKSLTNSGTTGKVIMSTSGTFQLSSTKYEGEFKITEKLTGTCDLETLEGSATNSVTLIYDGVQYTEKVTYTLE